MNTPKRLRSIMGTDCIVKVGDDYHSLDRWYCFSDGFDVGETVNIKEAKEKLSKLYYENEDEDAIKETFWLGFVNGLFSNKDDNVSVTFYDDNNYPEEYLDGNVEGDTVTICGKRFIAKNDADMIKKLSEYSNMGGLCPEIRVQASGHYIEYDSEKQLSEVKAKINPVKYKNNESGDVLVGFHICREGAHDRSVVMEAKQAELFMAGMREVIDRRGPPNQKDGAAITFVDSEKFNGNADE